METNHQDVWQNLWGGLNGSGLMELNWWGQKPISTLLDIWSRQQYFRSPTKIASAIWKAKEVEHVNDDHLTQDWSKEADVYESVVSHEDKFLNMLTELESISDGHSRSSRVEQLSIVSNVPHDMSTKPVV